MPKFKFPRKLSALLEMAVRDAKAFDRARKENPELNWDMDLWVRWDGEKCKVCMAGATLYRIGVRDDDDLPPREHEVMQSINDMRAGNFNRAYIKLTGREAGWKRWKALRRLEDEFERGVANSRQENPSGYLAWDTYKKYAEKLKEMGL